MTVVRLAISRQVVPGASSGVGAVSLACAWPAAVRDAPDAEPVQPVAPLRRGKKQRRLKEAPTLDLCGRWRPIGAAEFKFKNKADRCARG